VATRLSEHGTPVHVIEHILGHRLPALIRTYQLHVPLAEMREALDWWSDELDRILDRQPEREQGQT
jgi:integrase